MCEGQRAEDLVVPDEAMSAHLEKVLRGDLNLLGPNEKQRAWLDSLTTQQRVSAAVWILGRGAAGAGVATKAALMWPHTKRATVAQLEREATLLVTDVLLELLAAQPAQVILRIQQGRDARLSSEYE